MLIDPKGDLVTDLLTRLPRSASDRLVLFNEAYLGFWPEMAGRIREGMTFDEMAHIAVEYERPIGSLAAPAAHRNWTYPDRAWRLCCLRRRQMRLWERVFA